MAMRGQHGFTLAELMVAAAIVAILATLALPSFEAQRRRTARADGMACLVELQRRMDTAYARSNAYPAELADLNNGSDALLCPGESYRPAIGTKSDGCSDPHYCYTLIARPQGAQAEDGELKLEFDYRELHPSARLKKSRRVDGRWQEDWL